jgi:hypothetical protein
MLESLVCVKCCLNLTLPVKPRTTVRDFTTHCLTLPLHLAQTGFPAFNQVRDQASQANIAEPISS